MFSKRKGPYFKDLTAAWKRSKSFNFETTKPKHCSTRYLTDQNMSRIIESIREEFGVLGPTDLVQQCFGLHFMLMELIQDVLSCPVYFTLGAVEIEKGKPFVFHLSEDDVKDLVRGGLKRPDLNLHAWLTLPSMEILDLSLPTSLNALLGWDNIEPGSVISGHADELSGDLRYHPLLVGEDFLRKIGALVEFREYQWVV